MVLKNLKMHTRVGQVLKMVSIFMWEISVVHRLYHRQGFLEWASQDDFALEILAVNDENESNINSTSSYVSSHGTETDEIPVESKSSRGQSREMQLVVAFWYKKFI